MCEFSYVLRLLEVFKLCFLHLNNCNKRNKIQDVPESSVNRNPKLERLKSCILITPVSLFNPTMYNLIINIFFNNFVQIVP